MDIINVLKRIESLEVKVSSKKKKSGGATKVTVNAEASQRQKNAMRK